MDVNANPLCSDCGFETAHISEKTLARGASIREPGEALCGSCTSSRNLLVRQLKKIPDTLDEIRMMRRVRS